MTTLNLTDPTNGTVADANTIASNNSAIKAVVNGAIDNTNVAASAAIAVSKLAAGGSGQVLGMLAGVPTWLGGLAQIADSTVSGTAASIDFTSIPATYGHLLAVGMARGDNASAQNLSMRFNNDSAANYDIQLISGNATTAAALESIAATSLRAGGVTGTGSTAGLFSSFFTFIPQYAGATADKECVGISLLKTANSSTNLTLSVLSGGWRTTATAINRVTFFPAAGNFVTGSRITLYGLG